MSKFNIQLGLSSDSEPITWESQDRTTHAQIIGSSGKGKSKFLEHLIRQDIRNENMPGVFVLDPHGSLYDPLSEWIVSLQLEKTRKIHLLNPSAPNYTFGFNPLRMDEASQATVRVDAMVNACAQVWGGEDTSQTPLLKKCLRAVFFALLDQGYTLLEAVDLVSSSDSVGIRRHLTSNLSDRVYQSIWDDFNNLPIRQFVEQFSSTNNRLLEFLASPKVREVIGQSENALDFRRCMEGGDVVLLNLAPSNSISLDNAQLLGTLMLNEILLCALARDPKTAADRPFYVYIDECYSYLTEDIEKMLDQTRKFGVHLILAHQRLGQLRSAGEGIYNAVMTGTQTKFVFGGLTSLDAHEMAADIFLGELDLEEGVESSRRAVATGDYELAVLNTESSSEGEGVGEGHGTAEGTASTVFSGDVSTESSSESATTDMMMMMTGIAQSSGSGEAHSRASSHVKSWAKTNSRTMGTSEALKQIFETMPTERFSMDEQLYKAAANLSLQKARHVYVKTPGGTNGYMRVPDVSDPLALITEEYADDVKNRLIETSEYTSSNEEINAQLEARFLGIKDEINRDKPDDSDHRS